MQLSLRTAAVLFLLERGGLLHTGTDLGGKSDPGQWESTEERGETET
jgi:hypothetical protein